MGRSVMTLGGDSIVAYRTHMPDEELYRERWEDDIRNGFVDPEDRFEDYMYSHWNDADSQFEWEDLIAWIQETVMDMFPSMWAQDDWIGENHVIAANAHSIVTVSEYCGTVSVCLGDNYDRGSYWYNGDPTAHLGAHWRSQVEDRFIETFSTMTKLGTFSNGSSVYEIKKGA